MEHNRSIKNKLLSQWGWKENRLSSYFDFCCCWTKPIFLHIKTSILNLELYCLSILIYGFEELHLFQWRTAEKSIPLKRQEKLIQNTKILGESFSEENLGRYCIEMIWDWFQTYVLFFLILLPLMDSATFIVFRNNFQRSDYFIKVLYIGGHWITKRVRL